MDGKCRLDVLLVERGLFPSRERARAAVMAGLVLVDGQKVEKPGTMVPRGAGLRVLGEGLPYASRGGLKLAKAFQAFGLDWRGLTVLDAGASTGGFTDCLLQHGVARVIAVDVGYGQLAWRLRTDPRVTCRERTNIRHLTPRDLGEVVDAAVCDLSFISLALVFPALHHLVRPGGPVVALVKPQFEAGREHVGKKGVVKDPLVHRQVLQRVSAAAGEAGFTPRGITCSPIAGPEGNREYLLWLENRPGEPPAGWPGRLEQAVEEAFRRVGASAGEEKPAGA